MPTNVLSSLKPAAKTNAGDRLRLARHVMAGRVYQRLHEALEAAGIDHLVLKGPHLASMYYERPWQRGYNDIDLLVRPADFEASIKVLVQADFSIKPGLARRRATRAAAYDCPLLAADGSVIELHRDLSPHGLYTVDVDGLFSQGREFEFEHTSANGLQTEDLLIHLVIHAAKSQFSMIERKHLRDIRVVIEAGAVDWHVFIERAGAAGCRSAAWFFLRAAERQEGISLPTETMAALAPGGIRRAWAGLWLDLDHFPLLRHRRLPKSVRRLLLAPMLVDRPRQLILAAARFLRTRLADQWLWFKHRVPGV